MNVDRAGLINIIIPHGLLLPAVFIILLTQQFFVVLTVRINVDTVEQILCDVLHHQLSVNMSNALAMFQMKLPR